MSSIVSIYIEMAIVSDSLATFEIRAIIMSFHRRNGKTQHRSASQQQIPKHKIQNH